MSRHLMLTLRVVATVGFPALQFKAVKKQFVATRKVPIPDRDFLEVPARYPRCPSGRRGMPGTLLTASPAWWLEQGISSSSMFNSRN